MKRMTSLPVMLALALSGCVTATEQQQLDSGRYNQLHAAALALATKVDRGEMSEGATLQLAQMQFVNADQHSSAAVQGTEALVIASMVRDQSPQSACNPVGHILLLNPSTPPTREDHDCQKMNNAAAPRAGNKLREPFADGQGRSQ